MDPILGAALIGAGANLFGGLLSSDSASNQNKELMAQQYEYSKNLMSYQHDINSPSQYLSDLKDAGLSPAVMLSKGANQVQTSLGSTPTSDLAGVTQNKMIAAQIANIASQTAVNMANAKKTEADTKKTQAETEGLITDNQFKALLNQGNLSLMDSETQRNLKLLQVDDATIKKLHQEYELLVNQTDEIEANIALIKAEADKMSEETTMIKLQEELSKALNESQIAVNKQQIYLMSKEAYKIAKEGDVAALNSEILKIQKEFTRENESQKAAGIRYDTASKLHSSELKDKANRLAGMELQVRNAGLDAEKGLSTAKAFLNVFGQVFMRTEDAVGKGMVSAAAAAGNVQ